MKKLIIVISAVITVMFFTNCQKDFLNRYPLDQVTEPVFFKTPNDLKIYLNQYYTRSNFPMMTKSTGDLETDLYLIETTVSKRFEGTRTVNDAPTLNYTQVRSVNYFFEKYESCECEFEDIKQYVGEAHFFRAFFYFNLLKSFGGVPWITKVLNTNSEELYSERTPRNILADNIIAQLDTAAMYLSAEKTNGYARINKWIALLLQSRVALYEGTWEKYHNGTPFGVPSADPSKYFNKAAEAAKKIMDSGLYGIYNTGAPSKDYYDLFGLRDYSDNKEVMYWTKMDLDQNIHSHSKLYRMETPEGFGITKELVDSYLSKNGLPISESGLFAGYSTMENVIKDRDPRLAQTIFSPTDAWLIEDNGNIKPWSEVYANLYSNSTYSSATGYIRKKDYNPYVKYHSLNFEETPSIQLRYAEVLLNYAEAKAELGTLNQADIDLTIKLLRERVGMPNLTIASIATDPNWDFPSISPVLNEIRRERKVELALENLRWDDIARWAAADELIVGKRPKGALASQFSHPPALPKDAQGFIDPYQNVVPSGYGFKVNRDYLNPISIDERTLNPKLKQNPGWEAGGD